MKYDLTWGESVCVRQAFVDTIENNIITLCDKRTLMGMGYPRHEGNEQVVQLTRDVIKRQTGLNPKHVFLTNGATGAVVISLRAYFQHNFRYGITAAPPYFALYPDMVKNSGLIHIHADDYRTRMSEQGTVAVLDSPSNPRGDLGFAFDMLLPSTAVIWDAVYHNNVYAKIKLYPGPKHSVMCGSFSKLTGVNGLRVGWIATDDDALANTIGQIVTAEYVGLSQADSEILINVLDNFNWDLFEVTARANLDRNKDEWCKVTKYLGEVNVPANGMFHYAPVDTSAKYLMEKAKVSFMSGSKVGTSDKFGRFNLGQDNALVREAVKSILRSDRIFRL